jgi:hypothetical protein
MVTPFAEKGGLIFAHGLNLAGMAADSWDEPAVLL